MYPFLHKLGNIKIGGLEKGVPKRFDKIKITSSGKNGEENFEPHPDFPDPVSSISVILPLGELSFDVSKISFVLVEKSRFLAKDVNGTVYLFPIDPNYADPQNPFPVFRYGKTKAFEESLDLRTRAILYVLPLGYEKVGAFHFKTYSANSIMEIQNAIEMAKSFDPFIEKTVFTMELHSRYIGGEDVEEISFLRIVPNASSKNKYPKALLQTRKLMEREYAKAILEARDLSDPEVTQKYFGTSKPKIVVDKNVVFEGEIIDGKPHSSKEKKKVIAELEKAAKAVVVKPEENNVEEEKKTKKKIQEETSGKEECGDKPVKKKRGRPPKKKKEETVEPFPPQTLFEEPSAPALTDDDVDVVPILEQETVLEPVVEEDTGSMVYNETSLSGDALYEHLSEKYKIPLKVIRTLSMYVKDEEIEQTILECDKQVVCIVNKISALVAQMEEGNDKR